MFKWVTEYGYFESLDRCDECNLHRFLIIVCSRCGSRNHSNVSVRAVYKRGWFWKIPVTMRIFEDYQTKKEMDKLKKEED